MPTPLILIGVPFRTIEENDDASIAGEAFALPARTTVLTWQALLIGTPASIAFDFEIAIDEAGPWVSIDTADETDLTDDAFIRTIQTAVAARFGRITVTNGDEVEVTVDVLAKVASP